METKLVNVRLSEKLFTEGKKIVEIGGFSNFQELIRDAIRRRIEELKKERDDVIFLRKLFGSAKPRPRLTKEERDKIALNLAKNPGRQKEIFKHLRS